jgi:hypothetical protein
LFFELFKKLCRAMCPEKCALWMREMLWYSLMHATRRRRTSGLAGLVVFFTIKVKQDSFLCLWKNWDMIGGAK